MEELKTIRASLKDGNGDLKELHVGADSNPAEFLETLKQAFGVDANVEAWLEDDKGNRLPPTYAALQDGQYYRLAVGSSSSSSGSAEAEGAQPAHVGDGLLMGLNKGFLSAKDGVSSFVSKTKEGAETGDVKGFFKGLGQGTLDLAQGVVGGSVDVINTTIEGVRNTPDAIQEVVDGAQGKETVKNKFGVEGEGEGKILESHLKEEEKAPQHVGEGLLTGVTTLGKGLYSGAKDLAEKPMEGAQQGGAMGFLKGIGQGVTGATTKTLSGTLDAVTSVTTGIKNTGGYAQKSMEDSGGVKSAFNKGFSNIGGWFASMNDDGGDRKVPEGYNTDGGAFGEKAVKTETKPTV